MKLFASAAVVLCLLLAVHLSLEIPQLVGCPDDFLDKNPSYATECIEITCPKSDDDRGGQFSQVCPNEECYEGTNITRTVANNSLTYPDCCSRLISCGPIPDFLLIKRGNF